jgi:dipicolinate synthase subunit A
MKYVYRNLYERGLDVCFDNDSKYLVWDYQNIILVAPPKPDYDRIKDIFEAGGVHSFFGGALSSDFYNLGALKNVNIYDYLIDDEVVWENAVLTAKGILEVSKAHPFFSDTHSDNVLVLGYGNCGKALATELKKRRKKVYVAVRREALISEIEAEGYKYINLSELSQFLRIYEYSYIYNTIPAMILDKTAIDCLNPDAVIFDIASAPGGTDFEYCKKRGIEAHLSLGIPGKCYPDCAGEIIAGYINRIIYEI